MPSQAAETRIEIQIDEQFRARISPELLRQTALAALAHRQVEGACELTIVVTGDDLLHDLNRRHRDVDAPTDVLAFPDEPCPERGPFVGAPKLERYLGDVIVSFPRASAQAAEAGHDVRAELQLLVVHGVLHLLGYDDAGSNSRGPGRRGQSSRLMRDA